MCDLYIDPLMTIRYSHEAWGWVVSVLFMANRHSRVCVEKTLKSNSIKIKAIRWNLFAVIRNDQVLC